MTEDDITNTVAAASMLQMVRGGNKRVKERERVREMSVSTIYRMDCWNTVGSL